MLARFDIVLVAFPFTDKPNVKPRPAMVIGLSERHQDGLVERWLAHGTWSRLLIQATRE